jgi:hypothetical protein
MQKAADRKKYDNEQMKQGISMPKFIENRTIICKKLITHRNHYRKDYVEENLHSNYTRFLYKTCFLTVL